LISARILLVIVGTTLNRPTRRWPTAQLLYTSVQMLRDWSRAEKLGCATLVVGILGCIATWEVVPEFRRLAGLQLARDGASRGSRDSASSVGVTLTAASTAPESAIPAATQTVKLTNSCKEQSISAAVHYEDVSGQWSTTGWFVVAAGGTCDTGLVATGPLVYFYGENENNTWDASKGEHSIALTVDDHDAFTVTGTSSALKHAKTVSFFGREFSPGEDRSVTFDCD